MDQNEITVNARRMFSTVEKIIWSSGWVYILTNPAMDGVVKIGITKSSPFKRAKGLSHGTGIPAPFSVEYATKTVGASLIEKVAHSLLDHCRVSSNREFFRCSVYDAKCAVWQADIDVSLGLDESLLYKALEKRRDIIQGVIGVTPPAFLDDPYSVKVQRV